MMLEKLLRNLFLGGIAVVTLNGCIGLGLSGRYNYEIKGDKFIVGVGAEAQTEFAERKNIKLPSKFVPVHPDDAIFLDTTKPTEVNASSNHIPYDKFSLKAEGFVGAIQGGITGGVSFEYRDLPDTYAILQQVSDPRPPSRGSFVYDKVLTQKKSIRSNLGIEFNPFEELSFRAVYSFPVNEKLERCYGHNRFGKNQEIQNETINIISTQINFQAIYYFLFDDYNKKKKIGIGLTYSHEWLKCDKFKNGKGSGNSFGYFFRLVL